MEDKPAQASIPGLSAFLDFPNPFMANLGDEFKPSENVPNFAMTEFRRPYPAFNIPLTDEEKQLIGEIVAIQGQIEFLLGAIVHDALGLDRAAMLAIMHSASLKVNTHIFVKVIRAKIKNPVTLASAENIFARMEALSKGRNDFIHALYAYDEDGPAFSLVSGLALQLPFCFEVRALSDRLVSSTPE